MTRFLVAAALTLLFTVNPWPADGHLLRYPDKPLLNQLENRERSQQRNLHHSRYVCERGRRANRRWHCAAAVWIARELRETRAQLRPGIPWPWYDIAVCESGQRPPDWHINTGNGYYGGLQFLTSTWLAYGGGRYAPRADLAEPWQQVRIASGMSLTHWPVCGRPYR